MTQFIKGRSGNPLGRKKGIKTRKTLMINALDTFSEKHGINAQESIIDALIGEAMSGDIQSIKLILERIAPSLKPESHRIYIPTLPRDINLKAEKILDYAANGTLAVDEARQLLDGLSHLMKIREVTQIEERLLSLEEQANNA
ncbi:MAG: DUF5681 domain-containing protein [Pseudomonadota bacterium]